MKERRSIYGLYDVKDPAELRAVFYIGASGNLKKRLCEHRYDLSRPDPKTQRVQEIVASGSDVSLIVIEDYTEDWPQLERYWIQRAREEGIDLTNVLPGGEWDGTYQYFSKEKLAEVKAKISRTQKKRDCPEIRARISRSVREYWASLSDEEMKDFREKCGQIVKERYKDPEQRERQSKIQKEVQSRPEVRKKISQKMKEVWAERKRKVK